MFPDPNFLYDEGISVIREHLRQILRFSFSHGFLGPLGQKWGVLGKNRGRGGAILTPMNSFLLLGVYTSVQFGENRQRNATVRVSTDGQTHTHTHTHGQTQNDFIICPMLYAIAMGQIIIICVI